MEAAIAYAIRYTMAGLALLTTFSVRAGEAFRRAWAARATQPRTSTQTPVHSAAKGVPASRPMLSQAVEAFDGTQRGVFKVLDLEQRLGAQRIESQNAPMQTNMPVLSAIAPVAILEQKEPEPEDDLDWAGSLSHAMVSSLHLAQVLDLVRQGWLVPLAAKQNDVGGCLDVIAAFEERTACAISPIILAMTDAQRTEFFEGFEDLLPPELPELESQV